MSDLLTGVRQDDGELAARADGKGGKGSLLAGASPQRALLEETGFRVGGDGYAASPGDVEHREETERYVLGQAEPWHKEHLTRLYGRWHEWNAAYYEGVLKVPYIFLLA